MVIPQEPVTYPKAQGPDQCGETGCDTMRVGLMALSKKDSLTRSQAPRGLGGLQKSGKIEGRRRRG